MVEKKEYSKSKALEKSHGQLTSAAGGLDSVNGLTLQAASRVLSKLPERNERDAVSSTVDVLFAHAAEQMKDDSDKAVLEGLRKLIGQVEEDLYRPKPRYLDAFFFPNK